MENIQNTQWLSSTKSGVFDAKNDWKGRDQRVELSKHCQKQAEAGAATRSLMSIHFCTYQEADSTLFPERLTPSHANHCANALNLNRKEKRANDMKKIAVPTL
ncbi:hypothetical protein KIN20_019403 [Parelaphostrongylus tenuis]|uniref:Uncharacterized protein n=1 Tax=Parelaphostrongylus tenuis TaxID=148309 RepID=A0AAD5ML15_PARTN|nr:hypothetical protein KIN20_019403 [Parelaphostrongylus tenuis]